MLTISNLNDNQRQAVFWNNGPLLVLAGPGSGKTHVLTSRIARILDETAGAHSKLLALTFTNKAAAEMRTRIEDMVPGELNRVRLTTFHSYAAELLQQHGSHLDIRPDFQILINDSDREALIEEALAMQRKDYSQPIPDHFTPAQLLPAINRLLDRCVAVEDADRILQSSNVENAIPLARVYASYRQSLLKYNFLDFPSLIAEALKLLNKKPFIVGHIRKIYKHILVDEFQDTNRAQYQLLAMLIRPDPSTLFVVADDDQIIYQWNGASPKRIESLRIDFGVSELQLPENYRCPELVIEMANSLIEKNLNRSAGKKPLSAVKQGVSDDAVRIQGFQDINDEVEWIAHDIIQKRSNNCTDCAVIARTKRLLDIVGNKLEELGVPVYYATRKNEFNSAPLRMLHSILRLVNSKEDRQSLARLSKAFYEIEGIRIALGPVVSRASADGTALINSWIDEVKKRNSLEASTRNLLELGIKPLLGHLNYSVFADRIFAWAEQYQGRSTEDSVFDEFEEERGVWHTIAADINKKFEGEEISLNQFLQELDLSSKSPAKPEDAVPCFTVHASKGMEFGHVYLMGLVEDQLPSWAAVKKGDNSLEMQEERRNCFVAITRTQKTLTLTWSQNVFGWGKKPSRFLKEMGIDMK